MTTKFLMMAALLTLGLAGCKQEGEAEQPARTVDWYKDHADERTATVAKCNNDTGRLALTPNCVNASKAAQDVTWGARGGVEPIKPLTASDMKKK